MDIQTKSSFKVRIRRKNQVNLFSFMPVLISEIFEIVVHTMHFDKFNDH